jgi:hypothetical protein
VGNGSRRTARAWGQQRDVDGAAMEEEVRERRGRR